MARSIAQHSRVGIRFVALALGAGLWIGPPAALLAGDSCGTEFWLAFEENGAPGALSLHILGESGTTGSVEVPGLGFTSPFSVPAGGLATMAIPAGAMVTTSDGIEALGVHVTASRPVIVYGLDLHDGSADSFLALPVAMLGTDYDTISYTPDPAVPVFESQLAVVATADLTSVQVTPTATIGVHPPGVTFTVSLDAGQVYQGQSTGDLTGTSLGADRPIAVLSGNTWTNVPIGTFFADHLAEQLLPTAAWGADLFVVPSALRTAPERFRVQALLDGTVMTMSPGGTVTLGAGQVFEASFDSPVRFQADLPISVAHFAIGGDADGGTGDPFLLVALAVERFAHGYRISTADDGTIFPDNFVNIVVPAPAVGRVRLDGVAIPAGSFTAIGTTGFSYSRPALDPGPHRLIGPLAFGASVYGFGSLVSYGSAAGAASLPFADGFEDGDVLAWSAAVVSGQE